MDTLRSFRPDFLDSVPASIQIIATCAILASLYTIYSLVTADRPLPGFPVAALTDKGLGPKESWFKAGTATIARGLQENSGAFQIITGTGPKIVVPNRFADELKNHDDLNFGKAFSKEFFPGYHGFEPFHEGLHKESLILETVRVKLTQSLNLVTDDLVDETSTALADILGSDPEWHTTHLKEDMLELVARLSSRVFLGKELCRNRRWLDISKNFAVDGFIASQLLRLAPSIFRPIAYWLIPHCRRIRSHLHDADALIMPEVKSRIARVQKAIEAGQKPPKSADTIGWMYEVARGRKADYVNSQISLTIAAIHTTTEATTRAMIDLCEHPEMFQPLREEAIQVISENGWSKAALQKLRLMDSFLKESQRMAVTSVSMNRYVESDFQLSDGTKIPSGARLMVESGHFDPSVYPEPQKFDPLRFSSKRLEPGQVNRWGHVATSSVHMGFGHGQHACPGRFFASNEIRVALVHLLLKYDWKLIENELPTMPEFEGNVSVDMKCKAMVRRRKEEINVDLPDVS